MSTFNPFPVFQNSFGNIRIVSVQLLTIHVAVKAVDTKFFIYRGYVLALRKVILYLVYTIINHGSNTCLDAINASLNDFSLGTSNGLFSLVSKYLLDLA